MKIAITDDILEDYLNAMTPEELAIIEYECTKEVTFTGAWHFDNIELLTILGDSHPYSLQ